MKKLVFIIICLLITAYCAADTFTNRKTGKVIQGYATQQKKGSKTVVRVGDKQSAQYLDLTDYDIEWNTLGRRNQIIILPMKDSIELECVTEASEKAIKNASNQGPLLILIEIDTPGGRGDLMRRICDAIISADNCRTAAFVSGGQYGGAYSAGAIIALACDYIYMADGTAIGAAAPTVVSSSGVKDVKSAFGKRVGEKLLSADRGYIATLAEQNGRSGLLAKAMVDESIEVLEVVEGGRTILINGKDKKESHSVNRVLSERGKLLTLTSAEAVRYGIANRMLNSEEEIISAFGFEEPRVIHNQDITNAQQEFEHIKGKVKDLYNDIDFLKKDIDIKLKSLETVVVEIKRIRRIRTYWYDRYGEGRTVRRLTAERGTIKNFLRESLRELRLKYAGLISLNSAYPDLHVDVDKVKEEINSVDAMLKNINIM
jgi:uncharacterized lipoprotein YajG